MKFYQVAVLSFLIVLSTSNCWLFGNDYVDEFAGDSYEKQTAVVKTQKIWSKVTENMTPYGWYSSVALGGIFFEGMSPSFDYQSDQMPEGRKKYIHSVGSVGQVEFIPSGVSHKYTGIFKGCKNVLLRISLAAKPTTSSEKKTAEGADGNYIPGFGIKFMRDGVPSGNLVSMWGVDGQKSWNYFFHDFSNHIPGPISTALKALAVKFAFAQKQTGIIGLKALSDFDEAGKKENTPNFPFKLVFRPTPEAKALFPDQYQKEFLDQFDDIPKGMTIYDVYAYESGEDSNPTLLGSLKVKEKFVRSLWGDKNMFFKHNYISEDWKVKPHYKTLSDEEFKLLMSYIHQGL
jgi:hypothetical protein